MFGKAMHLNGEMPKIASLTIALIGLVGLIVALTM
jgi:preprotein translocase subunit Sss1